ncbi:MAG TPA: metallophosphoesterase [Phycisphaerae bacterium]|nr:metallophosphoesterase [Phycisphaerae bacterium]
MLKLLVVGDLHGDFTAMHRIAAAAALSPPDLAPDAVLLTGDFVSHDAQVPAAVSEKMHRAVARAAEALWEVIEVPVLYVPGNHDRPDLWGVRGCLQSIDTLAGRQPAIVRGVRILGVGGSWRFGGFPYEWEDSEEFERQLEDTWPAADEVPEVILFHAPPANSGVDRALSGECVGSRALFNIALRRRPKLIICGHIHEGVGPGVLDGEIPVFNAGSASVRVPPPFMMDRKQVGQLRALRVPGTFFSVHTIEPRESACHVLAVCYLGRTWLRRRLVFERKIGWRTESVV